MKPDSMDDERLARLQQAASLYRDDFLSGFTLADSEPFDEWQAQQAESLRRKLAEALQCLAVSYQEYGELADAITQTRRWLALDPLHEPAHRLLMRLYAQSGDRSSAVHQYEECVQTLADRLGMDTEEATTALYEGIRAGRLLFHEGARQEAEASQQPLHNLPEQPTSFIGRTQELAQIESRLGDPYCRLLTIVGPGGMGKTRLAIQAASQLQNAFKDGVVFVDLTAVASPDELAATILHAVAPDDYGDINAQRRLCDRLHKKHLLLVLDNFEHLLEGADLLPLLIQNAPRIKIMVTSRERLNLREEWLQPLHGLELPDPNDDSSSLNECDATQLLLDSVRRVRPSWQPSTEDERTITSICVTLEGMPLAIELAAGWSRTLPLHEVSAEMGRGLSILTTTMRDIPERHRSMHAVFDQSWRMASPAERSVLRQMSVFRSGCTRKAAEVVTGADNMMLSTLVDASWLRLRADGRYHMHELVRQYCEEKLMTEHELETGECIELVRWKHCDYYAKLLESFQTLSRFPGDIIKMYAPEFENMNAGMIAAAELPHLPAIHALLSRLWSASDYYGYQSSTQRTLNTVAMALLDQMNSSDHDANDETQLIEALAELYMVQVRFSVQAGSIEKAKRYIHDLNRLSDLIDLGHNELFYRSDAARRLCQLYLRSGLYEDSLRCGLEALKHYESDRFVSIWYRNEQGQLWHQADVLAAIGNARWYLGMYEEAEKAWRRSIALGEEIGEHLQRAQHCGQLARLLITLGKYQQALRLTREAEQGSKELGDDLWATIASIAIGMILTEQQRYREAREHLLQGVSYWRHSHYHRLLDSLTMMGRLEMAEGYFQKARGWYAEAVDSIDQFEDRESKYLAAVWLGLGWIELNEANIAEANDLFRKALASGKCTAWEKTEAIAGLAEVAAAEGRFDEAIELLALVVEHPFTAHYQREKSRQSLSIWQGKVSPNVYADLISTGAHRDLQTVINELLGATRSNHSAAPSSHSTRAPNA